MVSAVVLAHNDERTIEKTLKSLAWCAERIVVDDYSNDKTVSIAKRHKAVVYERHLNNDFAAQRNFALTKAKGQWVLFVDSDEIVPVTLREEIKKTLAAPEASGYLLRRQDTIFGHALHHGETSRVRLLRLGRKSAGLWERPVHEVWRIDAPVQELVSPLSHFPHPDVAQFLSEINRYSSLNAQYLFANKVRVTGTHILMYPVAKFFVNYVWYRGFADGMPGAIVAFLMSFHSFLTRAKLYLLWDREKYHTE